MKNVQHKITKLNFGGYLTPYVMAVGLRKPLFHPIAYFLVDRVDAQMQAQIIKEAINLLTDAGLDVHWVTFDGCAKNIATARSLGCNIAKFDGSFKHAQNTICHLGCVSYVKTGT